MYFYIVGTNVGTNLANSISDRQKSPSELKLLKKIIAEPLEILFNASFETGIVPIKLKSANVIPVYKKDSQFSLSNDRPISLLSIVSKLLEKLMCKRLLNFLEKEKILFDSQFGFRTNHSTDHAILSITDKIQRAIDERDYSCGIFLDLSKASSKNYLKSSVNYSVSLRQESCIKYLGIYIDSNLNWKSHIDYIAKKIKRSIGILSKLRYYVDNRIIINYLYYALIYPFLIYGMIAWGSTYHSNVQPLFILQKNPVRIMTFSKFDEHSSPLF